MQDISFPEIDQVSLTMNEIFYGFTLALKKYHFYMFSKIKDVSKESQSSIKKYIM